MMDFIAIDFETANGWNRASACAIGIVEVKDGVVINEYFSLINPMDDFDPYNITIHGITPEMVENEPTFAEVWGQINHYFNGNIIVAHNASFDMSVLRYCLNAFNINFPDFNYACSYLLGKRIYPGLPSYRLNYIYDYLKLGTFNHHDALEDSRAASLLFLNYLTKEKENDIEILSNKYEYKLGRLISEDNTYRPFSSAKKRSRSGFKGFKASEIKTNNTLFDKEHPFFNKVFAFTGTLQSMPRMQAMQKVVDVGGICGDGVTMQTNYLVIGVQDYSKYNGGTKSSKMKKAEKYALDGHEIEIITEDDFLGFL